MNFQKTKIYAAQKNEQDDCAVKAVSIACDVPYFVVHKIMANLGRKARRGTPMPIIRKTVEALGFSFEQTATTSKTVSSLKFDPAVAKGYHMALIANRSYAHILAIVNGSVEDWSDGSKRRICSMFTIKPAVSRKERAERKAKLMQG